MTNMWEQIYENNLLQMDTVRTNVTQAYITFTILLVILLFAISWSYDYIYMYMTGIMW